MVNMMSIKKIFSFSRYGVIMGVLMMLCTTWSCSALLYPAFDLQNQNGMYSFHFPCGDTIHFIDRTISPDGEGPLAWNWTIYYNATPVAGKITPPEAICQSNLSIEEFTFTVPCPPVNPPMEFIAHLEVLGNRTWQTYETNVTFWIEDYSEYIRANFSYSVDYEKLPANVTFFDLSEAQNLALINEWNWTVNYPNGTTLGRYSQTPIFTRPMDAGNYMVNLSIRDKAGDMASISKPVFISVARNLTQVSPGPGTLSAAFSANIREGTAPLTVQFYDLSTGSPTAWNWDFGDTCEVMELQATKANTVQPCTSTDQSPVHTYLRPGKYPVTLTVYNSTLLKTSGTKSSYYNSSVTIPDFIDVTRYFVRTDEQNSLFF
jgi:PKD repeat protein